MSMPREVSSHSSSRQTGDAVIIDDDDDDDGDGDDDVDVDTTFDIASRRVGKIILSLDGVRGRLLLLVDNMLILFLFVLPSSNNMLSSTMLV